MFRELYDSSIFFGSSNFRRMLEAHGKPYFRSGRGQKCHHLCVGGQSIRQLVRRMKAGRNPHSVWHHDYQNKNIIAMIGLINFLNGDEINTIKRQYQQFLCDVAKLGARQIFLCSVPKCRNLEVAEFNNFVEGETRRRGMRFIDVDNFVHGLPFNVFERDAIHFNRRCMAALVEHISLRVREG